jgi:UDP-3-O-[3-hydroxymyristoyl] glucosamine N-acyltransferase
MPDPRFFSARGPFSVGDLAAHGGATVTGDAARQISGVAPLHAAGPGDLSFFDHPRYAEQLKASQAGAIAIKAQHLALAPPGAALLVTRDPHRTYALAAQRLFPEPPVTPAIAPTAIVAASARIGTEVRIDPYAVIGEAVEIGPRCHIGAGAVLAAGVVVGGDCIIGAHVSLSHCILGNRVRVYAGARIGQDGFGFVPDAKGHIRVPQLGRVLVGDGCEIGANTTVDRGASADTVLGPGCWIDNLVHIGHNVQLGRGVIIAGMTGIAGSTKIGDFVAIGGQVGVAGHLEIGAGARIAGGSGVTRDVAAGETVGGYPAVAIRGWHRATAAIAKLARNAPAAEEE